MTLLDNHLEQISLSATAIAELPFLPPKVFTNALLNPHDITALIRDTEAHERALFTVHSSAGSRDSRRDYARTNPLFDINGHIAGVECSTATLRAPRRNTAVAKILGQSVVDEIRRGGGGGLNGGIGNPITDGRGKGEVDVDILLQGAAKLCKVYPIPGALERIATLRSRYEQLSSSIFYQEARVAKQAAELDRIYRPKDFDDDEGSVDGGESDDREFGMSANALANGSQPDPIDARQEEKEIKELERKKRGLEERVSGMERDLGGLLR